MKKGILGCPCIAKIWISIDERYNILRFIRTEESEPASNLLVILCTVLWKVSSEMYLIWEREVTLAPLS